MKLDLLLKQARRNIGKYCMEECNAYCCRKGTIPVDKKNIKLLKPKLIEYTSHTSMILPCPQLLENKCNVHTKRHRPQACKDFPIFLKDNIVIISEGCFAVKDNKLYPFLQRLKKEKIEFILQ